MCGFVHLTTTDSDYHSHHQPMPSGMARLCRIIHAHNSTIAAIEFLFVFHNLNVIVNVEVFAVVNSQVINLVARSSRYMPRLEDLRNKCWDKMLWSLSRMWAARGEDGNEQANQATLNGRRRYGDYQRVCTVSSPNWLVRVRASL